MQENEELAEEAEDWGQAFITRDIDGMNKMSLRLVTRLWDDEEGNPNDQAWVIDIIAQADGTLQLEKRRVDPLPWKK